MANNEDNYVTKKTTPVWLNGTTPSSGSKSPSQVYFPNAKAPTPAMAETSSAPATDGGTEGDDVPVYTMPEKVVASTIDPDSYQGTSKWIEETILANTESPEEKAKRERREKTNAVINGISDTARGLANLHYVTDYAPNGFDFEKGASTAHDARVEKARKEREANRKYYTNYALNLGRMKADDMGKRLGIIKHNNEQRNAAAIANQKTEAATNELNFKAWDTAQKMGMEKAKFDEGVRQFNAKNEQTKAQLSLGWARLNQQLESGSIDINLGEGHGNVTLTKAQLNDANVANIYASLPQEYQDMAKGTPNYEYDDLSGSKTITGYNKPSKTAMLAVIGEYLRENPDSSDKTRKVIIDIKQGRAKLY